MMYKHRLMEVLRTIEILPIHFICESFPDTRHQLKLQIYIDVHLSKKNIMFVTKWYISHCPYSRYQKAQEITLIQFKVQEKFWESAR